MRRFRTLPGDFDARCYGLEPIQDQWDDQVKKLRGENQARTIEGLKAEFGVWDFERKLTDFIAIGVVNRRLKGTPYRRAIGTPFWGS